VTATETQTDSARAADATPWHTMTAEQACGEFAVDPGARLDPAEVEPRRAQHGTNKLAKAAKEPGWDAFLRQHKNLMQLVLFGAAVVSVVALDEWHTAIVVFAVTLLNAILGLNQEGKAAESVAALQKMLVLKAHVRRGGGVIDIPAEELVPGDVVSFEAGDKIPADGRLLVAATLEIEEAAPTGESMPVPKAVDPVKDEDAAIGDRVDMAHELGRDARARGDDRHGQGMGTEVGRIPAMLSAVEQEKTPLTRQFDQLTIVVAWLAGIAIRLSRATLRTIKRNLAWAFGYNVAALPIAAAGLLNSVLAGVAIAASSVSVVANALRLRRFRSAYRETA
jgi:Ca2+-transporting ATPase